MIFQVIGAFIAIWGFSMLLEVPKKLLIHTSVIAAAGWLVYLLAEAWGISTVMAYFWSAMVISLLSHLAARILKAPVTVFLIGGILPVVPGQECIGQLIVLLCRAQIWFIRICRKRF